MIKTSFTNYLVEVTYRIITRSVTQELFFKYKAANSWQIPGLLDPMTVGPETKQQSSSGFMTG